MSEKRRAAMWIAVAIFVSLHASAALSLISARYPLNNVLFYALFGLPLLIGLLSASWRALALIPVMGFLFLLVGVVAVGRKGWDLTVTTTGGAGAAWFQRNRLRPGGGLRLPDGREYALARLLRPRRIWMLKSDQQSLARYAVKTGSHPWDTNIK